MRSAVLAARPGSEAEVVADGEVREQCRVLEDDADPALFRGSAGDVAAGEPDLLLLDEPLSALDQPTREDLRGVLQDLLSDLRIPAIHVTHDREEALILADDIAVIVGGQLRQVGPATEIASHPGDADVARILGWAELGTGTIRQGTVALGDLRLPTADGSGTAAVFYRPESITLAPTEPTGAFRVTRTIEQILPTVPLARVLLAGDPRLIALALQRDLDRVGARPGQAVEIELPPPAVKTFGK
ncbi:MAG TPA: hypothetical protein VJ741_16420 [Solirubrobacteraceae bacterium]|nr:hypothetical protein [Solirubrobacteraceae bacterium]